MTGFDDRKKSMEAKLAHDSELKFKVIVMRNKLLGLWAAELMGLSGEDAENYAREVIKSDFEEVGDDDVIRKLVADLGAKGIDANAESLRPEFDRCFQEAHDRVVNES